MRLIDKSVFMHQQGASGIAVGAVSYTTVTRSHLTIFYNDVPHPDFCDHYRQIVSVDNGRTWSEPRPFFTGRRLDGGSEYYNEIAAFLDPVTDRLFLPIDHQFKFDPKDGVTPQEKWKMRFVEYDYSADRFTTLETTDFGQKQAVFISCCVPLLVNPDKVLIPAKAIMTTPTGEILCYPGASAGKAMQQSVMIAGDRINGQWKWRLGGRIPALPMEVSSRGTHENSLARLRDGRLVVVMRGSNNRFLERPGFKWLAYSSDDGETWTKPEPVRWHDGFLMESGANCPALFRSSKTGKLYFIGNPCLNGERAAGNAPRSPLVICEVQEEPFSFRRDRMTIIDQRQPQDQPTVQFSNFRFYEDRENGDLVLFMTRMGEKDPKNSLMADLYRYRIELD
jgi:hypothetical protein